MQAQVSEQREDPDDTHQGDIERALDQVSQLDCEQRRAAMMALECDMLQLPQTEIPVRHEFNGSMYARQILIPKGTLITGRIHKFDHFDVMAYGDITLSTDSGGATRLKGYNLIKSKAGKKRAALAHEDTMWITFHSSPEKNPDEMYNYLSCGSFEEYDNFQIMLEHAMSGKDITIWP